MYPCVHFTPHNLILSRMYQRAAKETLASLIEAESEERQNEKDRGFDSNDPFNDPSKWTMDTLTIIVSKVGLKASTHGVSFSKNSLIRILKRVLDESITRTDFVPRSFGYNMVEYWLPIISNVAYVMIVTTGTIMLINISYLLAEHYHDEYECVNWFKMYSLQCYVLKKVRNYLEDMNYNIVYSTMCALSLALTTLFMNLRKYNEVLMNQESK